MKKSVQSLLPVAVTTAAALLPSLAPAQLVEPGFYMRTDPFITGEAIAKGHEDEIEIISWGWGLSNTASVQPGGIQPGTVAGQAVVVEKRVDRSSPELYQSIIGQTQFNGVELLYQESCTPEFVVDTLEVKMQSVVITSNSLESVVGGILGQNQSAETMTLIYESICITTHAYDPGTCNLLSSNGPTCFKAVIK